jgi:hypothetical protein
VLLPLMLLLLLEIWMLLAHAAAQTTHQGC